jgi:hypothetical protein
MVAIWISVVLFLQRNFQVTNLTGTAAETEDDQRGKSRTAAPRFLAAGDAIMAALGKV